MDTSIDKLQQHIKLEDCIKAIVLQAGDEEGNKSFALSMLNIQ